MADAGDSVSISSAIVLFISSLSNMVSALLCPGCVAENEDATTHINTNFNHL